MKAGYLYPTPSSKHPFDHFLYGVGKLYVKQLDTIPSWLGAVAEFGHSRNTLTRYVAAFLSISDTYEFFRVQSFSRLELPASSHNPLASTSEISERSLVRDRSEREKDHWKKDSKGWSGDG